MKFAWGLRWLVCSYIKPTRTDHVAFLNADLLVILQPYQPRHLFHLYNACQWILVFPQRYYASASRGGHFSAPYSNSKWVKKLLLWLELVSNLSFSQCGELLDYDLHRSKLGSSGLSMLKTLREDGFKVTCYERRSNVGGLWAYTDDKTMTTALPSKKRIPFIQTVR